MTVSKPTDLLARPEPVAVRTVWPREDGDFTPWLAENLDWLDVLGLGRLELVGTEVPIVGVGRYLDILARTPSGQQIAIENQYNVTDHDHLTRGIAYALGVKQRAHALVVIAEDHRAEFVAIADYLNTAYESLGADDGIAVYLMAFRVERVGQHYVPRFEVVSRPNTWLAEVQAPNAPAAASIADFLSSCSGEFGPRARQIVTEWRERPGAAIRVNPTSRSLTLDFPYSPSTGHRSVYVLYNNGTLTVNRGYFIESGAIGEKRVAEMDAQMVAAFPQLTDKPYYPTATAPPPEGVAAFASWLIDSASREATP